MSQQTWEAWHESNTPAETFESAAAVAGETAVLAAMPMGPGHSRYSDWLAHVENQPHQGV